ncbi:hypothetical protein GGI25_004172 [Coemansia spiralis]|uniref:AA9 family lytic polysaccharide monooxygenase n=2 Tax=Coemansia TaxID=4863 RepID=A0A9W8KXF8_9FUNG|nr:hypothetical protein EDC05_005602 [Coemansia umbellata]KAJ2618953.1 hypothetical protein GGI26_006213 [Coemansia sp. RSA 1358]KAJ2675024.1 hypothetical protein GGI25_004172 [Coemansia spiralis]
MKSVIFGSLLGVFASIAQVSAHTYLSHVTLDGTKYAEGVCIRPYPTNRNFPVKDPSSTDLTCGVGGVSSVAAQTCPVDAGSTITVEWHHNDDSASDDIIDVSHLGPCLVYMAPLSSNGAGDVWFKIFEDGYDPATKQWCVNKIRANGGKLDVTLPSDIKAGDYLLRTEVIALHEADADYAVNPARGAQYYPNCAQVSVSGGGDAVPQGYAIPGIYKTNSPGILFNLYTSFDSYPIPGPPVYVSGSSSSSSSAAQETSEYAASSGEPSTTDTVLSQTAAASSTTDVSDYATSDAAAPSTDASDYATSDSAGYTTTDAASEDTNVAPEQTTTAESTAPEQTTSDYDTTEVAPTSSAPDTSYFTAPTAAVPGKCH